MNTPRQSERQNARIWEHLESIFQLESERYPTCIVFPQVPLGRGWNKPSTGLLFRRQEHGLEVLVDEDLQPIRPDLPVRFEERRMRGWKPMEFPAESRRDVTQLGRVVQGLLQQGGSQADNSPLPDEAISEGSLPVGLCRDITAEAVAGRLPPVIGRDREIGDLMVILSKTRKNNAILVGDPGVGKTTLVEGLAQAIQEADAPEGLSGIRILELSVAQLSAGAGVRGEFEARLQRVVEFAEQEAEHCAIFIDEIHTLINTGQPGGSIGAGDILKPALSRGTFRCIGATTEREYRQIFEQDAALSRRFQKVDVEEPDREACVAILHGLREHMAQRHRIDIPDDLLPVAIDLSIRYVPERRLPDKAVDLIDESAARLRLFRGSRPGIEELARLEVDRPSVDDQRHLPLVLHEMALRDTISRWTGIPLDASSVNRLELSSLEERLQKRIIGQDRAISLVSGCLRRTMAGLTPGRRPHGVFLFLGPTGVGKTELARGLAAEVMGDEQALCRFDMSEYQEQHSVSRFTGSPPGYVGYGEGGELINRVRRRPFSVLLFDEVEKAHPNVFDLFLQIFEEGSLVDGHGRRADFSNTVIIMTGNLRPDQAGQGQIGFGRGEELSADVAFRSALGRWFRPEFLNRIDEVVLFGQLGRVEIDQIVKLKINALIEYLSDAKGIVLTVRSCVLDLITRKSLVPEAGAREVERCITRFLEEPLAGIVLERETENNEVLEATVVEDEIRVDRYRESIPT
jgi:ATP-dependent Clp protease ATP-binding subunit ClpC